MGPGSGRAELSLHSLHAARPHQWEAFVGHVLPLTAAALVSLNLSNNPSLRLDVSWVVRHCPRLELCFLNGTGLRGDVAEFRELRRSLARLDVADCPALSGDPKALVAALGPAFVLHF